mmetsp:Transcript_128721/g.223248  ORF Transcript_128721/g.223248 Transcript_128721/m.223248 type:complete len:167 (-) Transcript_128721:108-608(-)
MAESPAGATSPYPPADIYLGLKAFFWQEGGFEPEVRKFAWDHRALFEDIAEQLASGNEEHDLDWTILHQHFVRKFEGKIAQFLAAYGATLWDLQTVFQVAQESGDTDAVIIINVMMSMVDYIPWLNSMIHAVRSPCDSVNGPKTQPPVLSPETSGGFMPLPTESGM